MNIKKLNIQKLVSISGLLFVAVYTFITITTDKKINIKPINTSNYRLFHRLYANLGYTVKKANSTNMPAYNSVIIFLNYTENEKKFINKIRNWISKGGTLILAGIKAKRDPISSLAVSNNKLGKVTIHNSLADDVNSLELSGGASFSKNYGTILLASRSKMLAYKQRIGLGTAFVFADSAFFHKYLLRKDDIAVLVNNLIKPYYDKTIYYYYDNILIEKVATPIMILFTGNMRYVMIQLFIIVLLFVYWKSIRFGRPVVLNPYARRSLREHIMGIGHFYRKSKSKNLVDNIQINFFRFKLKKLLGIPQKTEQKRLIDKTNTQADIPKRKLVELLTPVDTKSDTLLMNRDNKRDFILEKLYLKKKQNTRRPQ